MTSGLDRLSAETRNAAQRAGRALSAAWEKRDRMIPFGSSTLGRVRTFARRGASAFATSIPLSHFVRPANAQHVGDRDQQEDACAFSDLEDVTAVSHSGRLVVVADGMGGLTSGREASLLAAKAFVERYARKTEAETVAAALEASLASANEAVFQLARSLGGGRLVGTTIAAAVLHGPKLYWISAGDTRVYVLVDGVLKQLNTDHVLALELDRKVEAHRMSAEEALAHPERESLTSYIGSDEIPRVDRGAIPIDTRRSCAVLLCTDGLYRALSDDEILKVQQRDPQAWADALVNAAREKKRPAQDNISVAILAATPRLELRLLRSLSHRVAQVRLPRLNRPARLSNTALFWLLAGTLLAITWIAAQATTPPTTHGTATKGARH